MTLSIAEAALERDEPRQALTFSESVDTAEALVIMGRAELRLGHVSRAVTLFRFARERAVANGQRAAAIDASLGLAYAIGDVQLQPAAGATYAESARTEALASHDGVRAARALGVQGDLAATSGDLARAERMMRVAVLELAVHGVSHELARSERALASVLRRTGQFVDARAHLALVDAMQTDLPADHPDVLDTILARANIDADDGRPAQARAMLQALVDTLEARSSQPDHHLLAPLGSLVAAQFAAGDYASARKSATRALSIARATRGELSIDVGQAYGRLAGVRAVQGAFDDAIELYRAGIAALRSGLGDEHPEIAKLDGSMASVLMSAGRNAEAWDAVSRAVAAYHARPGNDRELAHVLAVRCLIALALHHDSDARGDAEEALAITTRLYGDDHVALTPQLHALAQAELAAGSLGAARAHIERAISLHERAGGSPRQTVEERVVLARVLWQQGRSDEALREARRALHDLGADDPALGAQLSAAIARHARSRARP